MASICHHCGEPGAERFQLNGQERFFHANMLRDCLNEHLKEEQAKYFKARGVPSKSRGEKFCSVSGGHHVRRL